MKTTKRFIAGAVCPECKQMDRLVMYRDGDRTFRECVACGFHEEMLITATPQPLETRISGSQKPAGETQAVRFIDPKSNT